MYGPSYRQLQVHINCTLISAMKICDHRIDVNKVKMGISMKLDKQPFYSLQSLFYGTFVVPSVLCVVSVHLAPQSMDLF